MKISRLALKGFSSAYPGVVDLPIGEIPPGLIAVVGGNGQGKTSLLETIPGAIYRELPARGGVDPVTFATGRDSFIDLEYSFDASGAFRSRLNLDGAARKSDALLQEVLLDGSRVDLNNGQRSTYDLAIASRFPSIDLFLNSSFAAQGRGDAFTRATGSERKNLFVEFLALGRFLEMAKAAKDAADLAADARLRLTVQRELLERETSLEVRAALERRVDELQPAGLVAQRRKRDLVEAIAALEAREKMSGDQVAAFSTANERVRVVSGQLTTREQEQATLTERQRALDRRLREEADLIAKLREAGHHEIDDRLSTTVRDIDERVAGNRKIQDQGADIRAAVAAVADINARLDRLRTDQQAAQAERDVIVAALAAAEKALSAFVAPKSELERAQTDSALLATVPCGGAGVYAACQFLVNANAAAERIGELETRLAGLTAAIETRDRQHAAQQGADQRLIELRRQITDLTVERGKHEALAKYERALAESTVRVDELEAKRLAASEDARRQHLAKDDECDRDQARSTTVVTEQQRQLASDQQLVADVLAQLAIDRQAALEDLEAARSGNSLAVQLQAELTERREEWGRVIRTLADVAAGEAEVERQREAITAKLARLVDVKDRLGRVDAEFLEWQFFAKAFAKGGLPDLEIDAAGPEISAMTNDLLHASYSARFSLELVTQVQKADGSGMKDEFTVRVFDNQTTDGRGWRDISELSGGEKVVVQEALMCAICLYVNERSPLPIRTLFRDETGPSLDPENAVRYVQMLRKVQALGQFHHVFFVSHNPAAYALADTQLQVAGGQVRIVYPPFAEVA